MIWKYAQLGKHPIFSLKAYAQLMTHKSKLHASSNLVLAFSMCASGRVSWMVSEKAGRNNETKVQHNTSTGAISNK